MKQCSCVIMRRMFSCWQKSFKNDPMCSFEFHFSIFILNLLKTTKYMCDENFL